MRIQHYDNLTDLPSPTDTPMLIDGMPNEVYHSKMPGISKSGLDRMAVSPAHYYYAPAKEPTRAMEIGTAIHTALLEPERFAAEYVLTSADSRQRSEYREAAKVHGSERVLTQKEADEVRGMQAAVWAQPHARRHLEAEGYRELSVLARDPVTDVAVRCRPDLVTEGDIMVEVKSCQDAREGPFANAIARYGYDIAAAFYADVWYWATGRALNAYAILPVERELPHGCKIYVLPDHWLARGRRIYRSALNRYAECLAADHWPAYDDEPTVVSMPRWVEYEEERADSGPAADYEEGDDG